MDADEVILALDLYYSIPHGQISSTNNQIIQLSKDLNLLSSAERSSEKFRNPNGVSMKLSNFLSIDPEYLGKGLASASSLDKAIFMEFDSNREQLKILSTQIKLLINDSKTVKELYKFKEDTHEVNEGGVIYRLHKIRERNNAIITKKKQEVFKITGALACEICSFDFHEFYGEIGSGYIECHHKNPLSENSATIKTKLSDLALVCSNCHSMLHQSIEKLSFEDFVSKFH